MVAGGIASLLVALALTGCSGSSSKHVRGGIAGGQGPQPTSTASVGPPPTATPEPVTHLLFTGDVIPARCVYARIRALYVSLAHDVPPDAGVLVLFRVVLGSFSLAVPTILLYDLSILSVRMVERQRARAEAQAAGQATTAAAE